MLGRLDTRAERDWYAAAAAENGWSRAVLEHQIKVGLRSALGAAPTNFTASLDAADSELAQQLVKDPYVFEHLALVERVAEKEVEQALMDRLQDTLLEFGRGMAFVGRQVRLTVPDDRSDQVSEFYVDLLLFHVEQLRYVVIELKAEKFKPEHLGQLSFYLTAVDMQVKAEQDNPTIGLLLCKSKNTVVAEYALRDKTQPIGVAEYQLIESLPEELQTSLPSIEQIERELGGAHE